ncbi:MAG: YqgE/AlgH family protein [Planctomycetota bacterium]
MTNVSGRLLIASPYLTDGNFLRSVVFMVRHDSEGAFGVSINRPTERRFRDLVELSSPVGMLRQDDHLFLGGPVGGPILALHAMAGLGEPCRTVGDSEDRDAQATVDFSVLEDADSVAEFLGTPQPGDSTPKSEESLPPAWITGDEDHLRLLHQRSDVAVKFVTAYSGWGPGQLEYEMESGGWLVGDADQDILFGDPNEAWETAVRRCGHSILCGIAPGLRNSGINNSNPELN